MFYLEIPDIGCKQLRKIVDDTEVDKVEFLVQGKEWHFLHKMR